MNGRFPFAARFIICFSSRSFFILAPSAHPTMLNGTQLAKL